MGIIPARIKCWVEKPREGDPGRRNCVCRGLKKREQGRLGNTDARSWRGG